MPGYNVDEEVAQLANHIKRLGKEEAGGVQVTFKVNIGNKERNHQP